jgi:hypothetical protein
MAVLNTHSIFFRQPYRLKPVGPAPWFRFTFEDRLTSQQVMVLRRQQNSKGFWTIQGWSAATGPLRSRTSI